MGRMNFQEPNNRINHPNRKTQSLFTQQTPKPKKSRFFKITSTIAIIVVLILLYKSFASTGVGTANNISLNYDTNTIKQQEGRIECINDDRILQWHEGLEMWECKKPTSAVFGELDKNNVKVNDSGQLECKENGKVLFWDEDQWACGDAGNTDFITTENGLSLNSDKLSIDSPTCSSNEKLIWDGNDFQCEEDDDEQTLSFSDNVLSIFGGNDIDLSDLDTNAWLLDGNSGTDDGDDFIGTTDGEDLVFKTDGEERMRIMEDGRVGIGTELIIESFAENDDEAIFEIENDPDNPDNPVSFAFMEEDGDNIWRGLGSWTKTFNDGVKTAYLQTSTQALSANEGNAAFSSFRGTPYNRLVYAVRDDDVASWKTGVIFTDQSSQIEPPTGYFTVRQEGDSRTDFIIDYDGNIGVGKPIPTAKLHVKGVTSDDTDYALKVDDSSDSSLLSVRNDGLITLPGILSGGTNASDNLTLQSTSNATKGKIYLGANSVYDEVNDRLGINKSDPDYELEVIGGDASTPAIAFGDGVAPSAGFSKVGTAMRYNHGSGSGSLTFQGG